MNWPRMTGSWLWAGQNCLNKCKLPDSGDVLPEFTSRDALHMHNEAAVPFARVFNSLIKKARSLLRARASAPATILSSQAQTSLENSLLLILSSIFGQVLALRFSLYRFRNCRLAATTDKRSNRQFYDHFVDKILKDDLNCLFGEYPGLENLVTICLNQWAHAVSEFLERLVLDQTAIAEFFGGGHLGTVINIEPDLSDRHDGGRTVMAVQFSSGLRLVYKPKDLGSEEAYFSVLSWLTQNGAPLDFRILRILKRPGYGWVEYVEQRGCENVDEVRRYYRRAGQLLCIIFVLSGTDCHFDNLIACGEQPVLVDTEMLLQPTWAGEASGHGRTLLRTGLLPRTTADMYDWSGLGCVCDQPTFLRIPEWRQVNSDAMSLCFRSARLHPRTNVVVLGGTHVSPHDYVPYLVEGFRGMYGCILKNRRKLLEGQGPLTVLGEQKFRILARGTLEYLVMMSRTLSPKVLRLRSVPPIKFTNRSRFPGLEPWEIEALRQMDVPRFFVGGSAKSLRTPDGSDICAWSQSGFERVLSSIRNLSEADLTEQIHVIEFSWAFSALSQISPG
jgi:type 2 lantibiotic biosynthesis protein LanM